MEARPFGGEDPERGSTEDARHWISVYTELLRFVKGLAVKSDPVVLAAVVSREAFYRRRLDVWNERLTALEADRAASEQELQHVADPPAS